MDRSSFRPLEFAVLDEPESDHLFVNEERTVLVRIWVDGTVEVARRDHQSHIWGPPVYLTEEQA